MMQSGKSPAATVLTIIFCLMFILSACAPAVSTTKEATPTNGTVVMNKPLITHMYTADPSAHVFEGKIYIYPSHDRDEHTGRPASDNLGSQYDMVDYHVFSMDNMQTPPVDHGEVLHVKDVPWAEKQMWAPDAAFKNDTYYLYFPALDHEGIFRIGVATSKSPAGPFEAEPDYIPGSFSMDPCVFVDDDGQAYMYFGGLMGGQLERWQTGEYDPNGEIPGPGKPMLGPRVAKMSEDMLGFDGPVKEISILDEDGKPVDAGDQTKLFFEASWMHKYNGTYYFSYSTGFSRYLAYATGESPLGPFTFRGQLLSPVLGWTTHHSIVEFDGKWYLFYHDATLSGGVDHMRNVKVAELFYNEDGSIKLIKP
ncbi:MAG TPA: glycoside hydrolase family 43 protein [Anaerolineales bacterium]|nr:glycoside hydrolase family 43 protein [Anaerolineales bacterium]